MVGLAVDLRRRVEQAVDSVVDPCSAAAGVPAGLAEMGLLQAVDVQGGDVSVVLRVTHPSCFVAPLFLRSVEEAIAALPGVSSVRVRLAEDADWTPAAMSPAYRSRLAAHRARSAAATAMRSGSCGSAPQGRASSAAPPAAGRSRRTGNAPAG